jgi:transcriptional regulator with XRE-family HTH domain
MHPRKRKNASTMKLVGALVGQFRRAAGLTQCQLAELIKVSEETISSIEQGRRPLRPDIAAVLDQLLDTKRALQTAVENMPEIDMIPAWAEEYMDVEAEAIALSWYENQVLPGLLQTKSYAYALFRSRIPILTEEEIERRVKVRMERQEILHRKEPPAASFIISEVILRDRLGGDEVYAKTLRHVRACVGIPGVTVQVMPLGRQGHAGLNGPFILLETPDHQHLAYAETQRGSQLISDPDEVSILAQKYAMLRTQALNPEETKGLLDRLLGEQ